MVTWTELVYPVTLVVLAVVCVWQSEKIRRLEKDIHNSAIGNYNSIHREIEYQDDVPIAGDPEPTAIDEWKRELEEMGMSPTSTEVRDQVELWAAFNGR